MVANSFLSRLGLKLARFPSDDRISDAPERVAPQVRREPKISPLGFEVSDQHSTSLVGTSIFVRVSDDADDPSSGWCTVDLDDDGDPTIVVDIDAKTWLSKPIYLDYADDLKLIPSAAKRLDDDSDIIIDVRGYLLLNNFESCFVREEEPSPVTSDWYHHKFYFTGTATAQYNESGTWRALHMPTSAALEKGYYSCL